MNGMQRDELENRINGMGEDELEVVAHMLPDEFLWNELKRRYIDNAEFVNSVKESMAAMERAQERS